jgi:protein-L-isoaspartate(D-aspartate) O-methyltransferase
VPEPLKKQLAEGGRLVIPVGGPVYQELVLYEKKKGKLVKNEISSVRFVPMLDEEGNRY